VLSDLQCIVNLDTEIPDGAFELRVPEQELNGTEISGAAGRSAAVKAMI
jgi:hypothetical protein